MTAPRVCLERIMLRGARHVQEIPVDPPGITQGWWAVEQNGTALRRWTNGDAELLLPAYHGPTMLEIHVSRSDMTYTVRPDHDLQAA